MKPIDYHSPLSKLPRQYRAVLNSASTGISKLRRLYCSDSIAAIELTRQARGARFAAFLALLAVIVLCSSCHTKTVVQEVPVFVHDTLIQRQLRVDSIAWRDTVRIEKEVRGDTVFLREYISKWRPEYHFLTDTVTVSKEVPVQVTTTVTKEVPAKLSWWQRITMTLGTITLLLALGFGLIKIYLMSRR